jgi:hypothetical protein
MTGLCDSGTGTGTGTLIGKTHDMSQLPRERVTDRSKGAASLETALCSGSYTFGAGSASKWPE